MELFTSRETKRIATFKVLFTIIRTSFYIYIFVHTFLHLNCISDFGCLLLHNVSLKFIPCRDRWRMNIREELFSCSNNSFAYLKLVLFGLFFFSITAVCQFSYAAFVSKILSSWPYAFNFGQPMWCPTPCTYKINHYVLKVWSISCRLVGSPILTVT